jgi:hypothetical protein
MESAQVICASALGKAGYEIFVPRSDDTGGSGANFLISWNSDTPVSPSIVEGFHANIPLGRLADAPDIALGDVLGSCVFNLVILVVLDFLHRGESVYHHANQGHILSAGFGIVLIDFVGLMFATYLRCACHAKLRG